MPGKTDLSKYIDHTLLNPAALPADMERLCAEAGFYGFHSVCVNPFFVPLVKNLLTGSNTKTTTVIGFPLGMDSTKTKIYEAIDACLSGAYELDIVMNIGMAKAGKWHSLEKDITDILIATPGVIHKIIIETCYLEKQEKLKASEVILDSGAEFIKTSTGFGPSGATLEDIKLIRTAIGNTCGIKAAGGIKTLNQAKAFIKAGAARIGTSAGVSIIKEALASNAIY